VQERWRCGSLCTFDDHLASVVILYNPAFFWTVVGIRVGQVPCRLPSTETNLLEYIENCVEKLSYDFPSAPIILVGDLNQLSDGDVTVRTGLTQLVHQPTRGRNILDRLFVSHADTYSRLLFELWELSAELTTKRLLLTLNLLQYLSGAKSLSSTRLDASLQRLMQHFWITSLLWIRIPSYRQSTWLTLSQNMINFTQLLSNCWIDSILKQQ